MKKVGKNIEVVWAWRCGRVMRSPHRWSSYEEKEVCSLRTDGQDIWSYNLKVGWTVNGKKVCVRFSDVSPTTKRHISIISGYADVNISDDVYRSLFEGEDQKFLKSMTVDQLQNLAVNLDEELKLRK